MDPFKILRQQAATKRDAAVKAARAEYRNSCRLIDELAQSLPVKPATVRRRNGRQPIIELIADVMPKDKAFTIRDIMEGLRLAHPLREFHEPTVRTFFSRLIEQGMIRKLRKGDRGFILWAAAGSQLADDGPLSALSIADATETVLRSRGPLKATELVVAIQEQGYRSGANPRKLLNSLKQAYKRNGHRFAIAADGKWASV
jgi:hypothetical protein